MGLDYLVDDLAQINFNIQLGETYSDLGDLKKRFLFKSQSIIKSKNKMNKF
jgi:hypothetical protein